MHRDLTTEADRVAAVARLNLLQDEPMQSAFDDAALLASVICDTPISLVTVLDGTYLHFKAAVGVTSRRMLQEDSFCIHAIQQRDLFVVTDTLLDSRFREKPHVAMGPKVRFYAGMPVATRDGIALGTLCVLDTVPRELNESQKRALGVLSRRVSAYFEIREKLLELSWTIAEKERIERELRNSNMRFETFMDNSPLICFMKERSGRMIYYNRSFAEWARISREEWLGKDESEFFPAEVAASLRKHDEAIMESGLLNVQEVIIPEATGIDRHYRTYKFALVNASGERFLVGMSHEISDEIKAKAALDEAHGKLVKANAQLHELSITDALTGCRNRRFFDEQLHREFALATRHRLRLSVLMIDIDHFKAVNDTFGHDEGDRVLRHVAGLLMRGARTTDFVCRYGGEEFAILLPHTSGKSAFRLADRMRAAIEKEWDGCQVTISVGVETYSPGMADGECLVRGADEALYKAKRAGRNCVVLGAS